MNFFSINIWDFKDWVWMVENENGVENRPTKREVKGICVWLVMASNWEKKKWKVLKLRRRWRFGFVFYLIYFSLFVGTNKRLHSFKIIPPCVSTSSKSFQAWEGRTLSSLSLLSFNQIYLYLLNFHFIYIYNIYIFFFKYKE